MSSSAGLRFLVTLPLFPFALACASGQQRIAESAPSTESSASNASSATVSEASSSLPSAPVPLAGAPKVAHASVQLPDGAPVWAGETDSQAHLAEWKDGAWAIIELPEELRPKKGLFNQVSADAQGNLYVSYRDTTDYSHELVGILGRVDGTWTKLGEFEQGWTNVRTLTPISSKDIYVEVWLMPDRRSQLLHWDGASYSVVTLPTGTKEVIDLALDRGTLVAHVEGDGVKGTYRLQNGSWTRMGAPPSNTTALLFSGRDGSLWRLGGAIERWNGAVWAQAPESLPDGFEIKSVAAGAHNELFLVLEDGRKHDDYLAALRGDKLSWLHGSVEKAHFEYNLNGLVCDASGVVHVSESGDAHTFNSEDIGTLEDGYPGQDAKAREVLALFNSAALIHQLQARHSELHQRWHDSQSDADYQALQTLVGKQLLPALDAGIDALNALQLAPWQNRLFDAYLTFLEANKAQYSASLKLYEAMHAKTDAMGLMTKQTNASHQVTEALTALEKAGQGYQSRNGL